MPILMNAGLSIDEWHRRFLRQLSWTADFRRDLFTRTGALDTERILDVGCGTGALGIHLRAMGFKGEVHGVDPDPRMVEVANANGTAAVVGRAERIRFPNGYFDTVVCHFTLMWVNDPARSVSEMVRVCRPEGLVAVLAEPDYSAIEEDPPGIERGPLMREALMDEGADPDIGGRLPGLFKTAGLKPTVKGLSGWRDIDEDEFDAEWDLFERTVPEHIAPRKELKALKQREFEAVLKGTRRMLVPVNTAWALKPGPRFDNVK